MLQPGIESLSTPILRQMDKGTTFLQNVRFLKWCAEIGIVPIWYLLYGFPDEDPAEYVRMADLLPALVHLEPPRAVAPIRLDRFSLDFEQAEVRGFVNVRAAEPYRYVFPFAPSALDRLAYTFEFEYADGRDPRAYAQTLLPAWRAWNEGRGTAKLELRVHADRLEIEDTRPIAVERLTVLRGAERLAYLALDAGTTLHGVQAVLQQTAEHEALADDEIQSWLRQWVDVHLVIQEGTRYLSLATNLAERVRPTARARSAKLQAAPAPALAASG
jgi:hypothetical protein